MCGIVGIYSGSRSLIGVDTIKAMNDRIYRRGPDDEGFYIDPSIHLGMRRLSIIDISAGHQPIFNQAKDAVIVFNGEIYNHNELRQQLISQGHKFETKSDTEVIIHLYDEFGIDCVKHLRGMFAFCIWDIRRQKGYLFRDRFGIKPVYIAKTQEGHFLFASEIKAILASGQVEKRISPSGLDAYLAYNYIPSPLSIYEGISKLPPAHYIEFDSEHISDPMRYWDANDIPIQPQPSDEEVEHLIQESVSCHMESDVPIGAFLSGGIDSSLVTAIASSSKKFSSTYTVGYSNVSRIYDERPLAKQVAKKYGIKDSKFLTVEPDPEKILREAIKAFDEPFADDSLLPTWVICELASEDVKVCLTGLGGDEIFGGYYRYLGIQYYARYARLPLTFRKMIYSLAQRLVTRSSSRKMDHIMRFLKAGKCGSSEAYTSFVTAIDSKDREEIFVESIKNKIDSLGTQRLISSHFDRCSEPSLLKKAIYADINTYVPEDILTLSDKVSMWHSLELRVPLMDHILFERCFRIDDSRKITRSEKKILLRKIARKYLPESLFKAKKQGFESPMAEWINTKLRDYIDKMLNKELIERRKIFDSARVCKILSDHRLRKKDNSKIIFSLLMFQVWYEECFLND